ncbi:MAG TPA: hypothetical protein VFB45_06405 [Pseudolabrys sp.]|nr:hypothetical protein [Pseudolabrys sp.]
MAEGKIDPEERAAAARYVAALAADLANISRRHGFDTLGHLLDIAKLEADNAVRNLEGLNP